MRNNQNVSVGYQSFWEKNNYLEIYYRSFTKECGSICANIFCYLLYHVECRITLYKSDIMWGGIMKSSRFTLNLRNSSYTDLS